MKKFYTVGIGASAGGLEALERFFQSMPEQPDMAFIVIQHLSPDYKSMMAEILSKYTKLPVREAENNCLVEINHVYLIPPKKTITVHNGYLFLTEKEIHRGISLPIDAFFHSLAVDFREHAIAVILSGTGSDGTRGIRSIKENDGLVIVQQADTAKFDGMPSSAISTGLADFILAPENICQALFDFTHHPSLTLEQFQHQYKIYETDNEDKDDVSKILDILKKTCGVDFFQYKLNTILRRIERRVSIRQCTSLNAYLKLIEKSKLEQETLFRELLIGVTKFFRDIEVYDILSQRVIPALFANSENDEPLRIWVAACSTGEEAYSLAILFAEYKEKLRATRDVKIFATDIDQRAVDIAAAGTYPESIIADIDREKLSKYFKHNENEGNYTITPNIRSMVVFACHDLTKSPPFNRLDLISCRNLFIYLKQDTQERILSLFHFALHATGYLLLGESENIGDHEKAFNCLDNRHKLYQVRPGVLPKLHRNIPAIINPKSPTKDMPIAGNLHVRSRQSSDYLQHIVLNKMLPPCILINDALDVLYVSSRASRYLTLSGTPDYSNLTRLMDESMVAFVRSAVINALKDRRKVTYKMLSSHIVGSASMEISVEILDKKYGGAQLLLLSIDEQEVSGTNDEVAILELSPDSRQHIEELERELSYTRETLQATIEELETSNEELQSTNEELIASNEELQSTNEELQAVNEELITINSEHQYQIKEITELNEMLNNLLSSSRVGSVFLDKEFQIRRFTPAVCDEIYLREQDIGRSFEEIRHHLEIDDLYPIFTRILNENKTRDIEVHSTRGKWYILRLAPFLLTDNTIDGIVLTLIDVSEIKQVQEQLAINKDKLKLAQQLAHLGSWENDLQENKISWSDEVFRIFGLPQTEENITYEMFLQRVHPEDRELVHNAYQNSIDQKLSGYEIRHRIIQADTNEVRYVYERCLHQRDESGNIISSRGMVLDVTDHHLAEEENLKLSRAVEQSANAIIITNCEANIEFVNPAFEKSTGYTLDEVIGKKTSILSSGETSKDLYNEMWILLKTKGYWQGELVNRHKDGHLYWDFVTISSVKDKYGKLTHYLSIQENITKRKEAEQALIKSHEREEKARHAAEAANMAKSAFLTNMSHELRTPLNAMMGYAQILSSSPDLSTKYQGMAEIIKNSGEHLLTLLNDILDLSRVEAGRSEISLESCNTKKFLKNIADIFTARAHQKGLIFDQRFDPALPTYLSIDEKRVRQVIFNLLGNAVKFTDAGAVSFCCSYSEKQLFIAIRDTGVGIERDQQPQLFQPFQQLGAERYKAQGTGLGLTISYKLVKLMGGVLEFFSEPQQGCTFICCLPCQVVEKTEQAEYNMKSFKRPIAYKSADKDIKTYLILIVDDDKNNCSLLKDFLEPLGFIVHTASSGENCLALLEHEQPDLIFMDLKMPGLNGLETTQKIREKDTHVPVIAVSASTFNEDLSAALNASCTDHLAKPVQEIKLLECIEKYLMLSWVYDKDMKTYQKSEEFLLPKEDYEYLLEWVNRGKISEIFEYLMALRKQPEYREYAQELLTLAQTFDLAKLREYLKKNK